MNIERIFLFRLDRSTRDFQQISTLSSVESIQIISRKKSLTFPAVTVLLQNARFEVEFCNIKQLRVLRIKTDRTRVFGVKSRETVRQRVNFCKTVRKNFLGSQPLKRGFQQSKKQTGGPSLYFATSSVCIAERSNKILFSLDHSRNSNGNLNYSARTNRTVVYGVLTL